MRSALTTQFRRLILILIEDGLVEVTLCKKPSQVNSGDIWWPCVVKGDPEISVKDIEGAKYLDDSILVKIWEQVRPSPLILNCLIDLIFVQKQQAKKAAREAEAASLSGAK